MSPFYIIDQIQGISEQNLCCCTISTVYFDKLPKPFRASTVCAIVNSLLIDCNTTVTRVDVNLQEKNQLQKIIIFQILSKMRDSFTVTLALYNMNSDV
jgi:hypothetical protein